jgi:hypothetical protein
VAELACRYRNGRRGYRYQKARRGHCTEREIGQTDTEMNGGGYTESEEARNKTNLSPK